ncbi:MAG: hypothetical protein A2W01_05425 [Candidatus Solincola sediminis]|nr:MAG: hypothetical protein A2W01_05425 [Candidatus Solincola sediminis]
MKYIVLVPDGAADLPVERYGGLTPLQAAATPNMDFLAKNGICGTAVTIPPGMPAGSDVANCSILGYDPRLYYSGRGPLEAASMGIGLGPEDVAFRCNLVTEESGVLVDFSAGHISSQEAAELIAFLNERLGDATGSFYAGISYRHLLVLSGNRFLKTRCIPPHDVVGSRVKEISPQGEGAEQLVSLMEKSRPLLTDHPVNKTRLDRSEKPANMIWPWGQGKTPALPTIPENYRIEGQKTGAFEICDDLGRAPDYHYIPVGNAGNITAYWKGYTEYRERGRIDSLPSMMGWQAEGAAPIVRGRVIENPETIATAIRIGNPASWERASAAASESGGVIDMVSDEEILDAYRLLAEREGIFVEPASAASVAGLYKTFRGGGLSPDSLAVCVLTGHGLKDPDLAVRSVEEPQSVPPRLETILEILGL